MVGLLCTATLMVLALTTLAIADTLFDEKFDEPYRGDLNAPKNAMPPCSPCQKPSCDIDTFASSTNMTTRPYTGSDGEEYKLYVMKDDLEVEFDVAPFTGISGTIQNTANFDALVSMDVWDATFLENKHIVHRRSDKGIVYKIPQGRNVEPPPINLISKAGTTCKFNLFPSGFAFTNGNITVFTVNVIQQ